MVACCVFGQDTSLTLPTYECVGRVSYGGFLMCADWQQRVCQATRALFWSALGPHLWKALHKCIYIPSVLKIWHSTSQSALKKCLHFTLSHGACLILLVVKYFITCKSAWTINWLNYNKVKCHSVKSILKWKWGICFWKHSKLNEHVGMGLQ